MPIFYAVKDVAILQDSIGCYILYKKKILLYYNKP